MLRHVSLIVLSVAVGAGSFVAAQEPAPQPPQNRAANEQRLQELLKKYPEADKNKDGKLTVEEAQAYRATVEPRRNQKQRPGAAARAVPTQSDVAYGSHPRQVFDFYQAESDKPTPLILYIHGGGFVAGDKNTVNPAMVQAANEAGISLAALHYRFVNGDDVIFPTPQLDCARALQFIRSRASEFNIDPERVASYGGSAGAGISMWLGFHDDLADPESDDPVARQSTRLVAIGTMGGQSTYDPIEIKKLVGGRAHEHPSIYKVYGQTTLEDLLNPTPEKKKLYDEASAITHLTKDDPPLYMIYSEPDVAPGADARPGQFIHHPNFGHQLEKAMDDLGIANVYVHTSEGRRDTTREMLEFFQKAFANVK